MLLAVLPIAAVLTLIFACATDVPLVDDWSMVDLATRASDGSLTWDDVWHEHNEHRALFPRLVIAASARLTGWDLRAQMFASVFVVAIALLLVGGLLYRTPGLSAWSVPVAAAVLFSLHGWRNWLWGCQIHLTLATTGAVGALALLGGRSIGAVRTAVAAAFALVASWSFLAGFAVWPMGLLVLVLRPFPDGRRRRSAILIWCLGMIVAIVAHVATSASLDGAGTDKRQVFESSPRQIAAFASRYQGAGLVGASAGEGFTDVVGTIGQVGLVLLGLAVVITRRRRPDLLALVAIGGFGLGCGYMIALGRVQHAGIETAAAPRYAAFAGLAWLTVLIVPAALFGSSGRRIGIGIGRTISAAGVIAWLATQPASVETAREASDELRSASARLRTGEGLDWDALNALLGDPVGRIWTLGEKCDALRAQRLSLFRDAGDAPAVSTPPILACEIVGVRSSERAFHFEVAARGGAPGNLAMVTVEGQGVHTQILAFDSRGEARCTLPVFRAVAESGLTLLVFGLDRRGHVVRGAPLPWKP